jgi:hypothetical protein
VMPPPIQPDAQPLGPVQLLSTGIANLQACRHPGASLGWRRLPIWMSRFAGQFVTSYHVFRADLGRLFKQIGADKPSLIWLLLVTLAGTAVRIWFLDQPMRYDEAQTYLRFVRPGVDGLFYYPIPNNHVAHSLLVYLSTSLFGAELWAIRLPAFLAGVLLMPTAFLCARTVFHRSSGLLAAGLVAGDSYLVLFSTNARGYTMIALLVLALVPLTLYMVRRESAFAGLLVALLSAIALYTIPIMVFAMAMLGVWSLLVAYLAGGMDKTVRVIRLVAWTLVLCAIVTLVLYTPVAIRSGLQSFAVARSRPLGEAMRQWWETPRVTWLRYLRDIPVLCQVCLGVCMLVGTVYLWKANRPALLLIPATPIGIGAVLLAMRVVPFQRTWIFLLPLGFCLADVGVTAILRFIPRRASVSIGGAVGLLFALGISYRLVATDAVPHYPETGEFPDAEAITLALKPHLKEGDRVLAKHDLSLYYYFLRFGMPLEVFDGKEGDGDIYVVVQVPSETFEKVRNLYHLPLSEEDFVVERFPSTLLYLPRGPGD